MKYISYLRPWCLAAVIDIVVMALGICLWAVVAPGVAVIQISKNNDEMIFHIIPQEFVHEFDAIALWIIILFICGFLMAWINFYFTDIRGMVGLIFSLAVCLISAGFIQRYGTAISFWWMRQRIDPIVKTFPPHTKMGLFYFLTNLPEQQLSIFNFGNMQLNLTTFTAQYVVLMAGAVGVAVCFLVRTLVLPIPKLNSVIS